MAYRCHDDKRYEDYPECAEDGEIDEFLRFKTLYINTINTQMDFTSWKPLPIK